MIPVGALVARVQSCIPYKTTNRRFEVDLRLPALYTIPYHTKGLVNKQVFATSIQYFLKLVNIMKRTHTYIIFIHIQCKGSSN